MLLARLQAPRARHHLASPVNQTDTLRARRATSADANSDACGDFSTSLTWVTQINRVSRSTMGNAPRNRNQLREECEMAQQKTRRKSEEEEPDQPEGFEEDEGFDEDSGGDDGNEVGLRMKQDAVEIDLTRDGEEGKKLHAIADMLDAMA